MNDARDEAINVSTFASQSGADEAASHLAVGPRRAAQRAMRSTNWRRQSEKWRHLMAAAQGGESRAYETLLRELDAWLRRYYARRLPAAAAEDARQDALLAIHAKREAYSPSKPFGPWVVAIARYKWIDHLRDASRFAGLSLHDEIPTGDPGEAAINAVAVDDLLRRLKPAQARVIRLVKLQGVSIEGASDATGQSAALVKVNIHRGLKKLAALAAGHAIAPRAASDPSGPRSFPQSHHCTKRDSRFANSTNGKCEGV